MVRRARELTVLFADVCGSTELYCTLGDDAARRIVSAALEEITGVLPRFEGQVVKTLGDEVMCTFRDPDQAILAAAEMQSQVSGIRPGGRPVAIHVGLHHGPVLVEGGDVFGDTVNAASHLCAVATAGQILTAEPTMTYISEATRAMTRPLFFVVLKGASVESTVYQVLWQQDSGEITDVNLRRHNLVPPDGGSVIVSRGQIECRLDPRQPRVSLGRDATCDIPVADSFASRRHAVVVLRRTQSFLVDLSTNGTFVRSPSGGVTHLFRSEMLLEAEGEISLGRAFDQADAQPIRFRRDRRALYRV